MSAPANGTGAIDPTTLSQSIQFFGESVENSLVGNVDTLFFISHSVITPGGATLGSFPKTGTSNTQPIAITELDESFSANAGPVGLAASDTALVWVESVDVHSYPEVGCQVFYLPLPLTAPVTGISPIFSTKKFSCMDAALDTNGDIYFAIVSLDADANEMHGDGIGRVQTHGSEFNSIALGIVGEGAGPRRLYLDGASIYAVDPQVIGKIAKSSLDGQHDFSAE